MGTQGSPKPAHPSALKDVDIRVHFQKWLEAQHPEPDTRILHEMKVKAPSARIDIALINGSISGYEIKSDVDTLARLERQAKAFGYVFDNICLVVTDRFAKVAEGSVPDWWGIIHCRPTEERLEFCYLRTPGRNTSAEIGAQIAALSRAECLEILLRTNLADGVRGATKPVIRQALQDRLAPAMLKTEVREALKRRADRIKEFKASQFFPRQLSY